MLLSKLGTVLVSMKRNHLHYIRFLDPGVYFGFDVPVGIVTTV